jgi:hypothetical protein
MKYINTINKFIVNINSMQTPQRYKIILEFSSVDPPEEIIHCTSDHGAYRNCK